MFHQFSLILPYNFPFYETRAGLGVILEDTKGKWSTKGRLDISIDHLLPDLLKVDLTNQ